MYTASDFFPAIVVGCFGMCAVPILRAIMSKMTPPDKQGTVPAKDGHQNLVQFSKMLYNCRLYIPS